MPIKLKGSSSGDITLDVPATAGTNTLTLPAVTDTLTGIAATQTLTNKTLTSPTITGPTITGTISGSPTITSPTINGTPVMGASVITSGTAQASTSGTSIDFNGIPSWVKRITVMFNGVSVSGTSAFLIQIGSGSFTTSGYQSGSCGASTSSNVSVGINSTAGFIVHSLYAAGANSGIITLALVSSNTWVESHSSYTVGGAFTFTFTGGGTVALGGTLDRVRITTANGTDTFDAGSINILYE
jgi:hypothetical protein